MNVKNEHSFKILKKIINCYCNVVKQGVHVRAKLLPQDLNNSDLFDVVFGLLATQANFTLQFAKNPGIWNQYIAPIIFRVQVDSYITLAWILKNEPHDRAKKYILYGLGQEKLQIEHLKEAVKENIQLETLLKSRQEWLNSQLLDIFTEVNLGSWSDINTRKMAEEADCLDLYNGAYTPFSAAVHNTWQHVERYSLYRCKNSLHKKHRLPLIPENVSNSIEELLLSSKYVQKAYLLVDERCQLVCHVPQPHDYLLRLLTKFNFLESDKKA